MSNIIETLTEGIVNRNMAAEGKALLDKWSATGLLEGLESEHKRSTMARLLENQAKELLRESSSLAAGDVAGFAAVAFPIVRRVFAGLIANDLVSVQPMSLPSGLIFFMDFVYSADFNTTTAANERFGNEKDKSIYGTTEVGSQITGGVNIVDATSKQTVGMRQAVGYAYGSALGEVDLVSAGVTGTYFKDAWLLDGSVSEARKKLIMNDPDLLSITDSGTFVTVIDVQLSALGSGEGDLDYDNLSAFSLENCDYGSSLVNPSALETLIGIAAPNASGEYIHQVRRLTQKVTAAEAATTGAALRLIFSSNDSAGLLSLPTAAGLMADATMEAPVKDDINAVSGVPGAVVGDLFALEGTGDIPEIDIKVDSIAITAQTKKLKAKWTPELGQDLNAYHNLDAEVELTSILSEQIALEIDREILADLVNGAKAGTYYWSRSPGLFVHKVTGQELGATAAAPDFTGTVSEWYETLIETMNDISAQIHRKTLRGGANFCVVSPEVANILEFTSGFRASITADADKGTIGAVKAGSLSRKWDVIVDPYFPRNIILMGRKGSSFLESGYVYAPYVPLQTTPTIFGPEDFVPRKGVMTRYAKKMVRPDMYGVVIVRGLLGESGS